MAEGYLASQRFDYDAYFQENPGALEDDADRDELKANIFFSDMGQGQQQFGGIAFGLVGISVGAIYGIIDTVLFDAAIDSALDEARQRNEDIQADVERVMNFRADIENKIAQYTTPQEQALRERARLYGLQIRAQGLSGAQAIAAQAIAEQQYRNVIGAELPNVIGEASREARADALTRLQAIEAKYGLVLANERQTLLEVERAAQLKSMSSNAMVTGIGAIGSAFGGLFDLGVQNQQRQQQQTGQSGGQNVYGLPIAPQTEQSTEAAEAGKAENAASAGQPGGGDIYNPEPPEEVTV
jgi:hypothetical protein